MEKRGFLIFLAVSILLIIIVLPISVSEDVPAIVEINVPPNEPPLLIGPIPDQTWATNTNLTNAFDLDDYFFDNETITYNSSSIAEINILIDSSTNQVSFYPDYGFSGSRTVTFTATDPLGNFTDSNEVTLNVVQDNEPPTWANASKSSPGVAQNDYITFSTVWEDNIFLGNYIFSINQGSGWTNYSTVAFSGVHNISTHSVQISAAGGTVVYWAFYGFDSSGNMNVTDVQSFTVAEEDEPPPSDSQESGPSSSSLKRGKKRAPSIREIIAKTASFSVSPEGPIKLDIKQGARGTLSFKVTNTGDYTLSFEIETYGFEDFEKTLNMESFNLSAGKSITLTSEFKVDKRQRPDIYHGGINFITSSAGVQRVPISVIVNPLETRLGLDVLIHEKYKRVMPGKMVKANITIKNIKDVDLKKVTLYYAITNFEGDVINSATDEFNFNEASISFEKNLSIPSQILPEEYLFFVRATSNEDMALDSDIFTITEGFDYQGFIRANFLFIFIILSAVIAAIFMMRYYRNKDRLRLLNLYLLVTELNKFIKEDKIDDAINLYVKIKSVYGEPVASTTLKNKDLLKKEISELTEKLNIQIKKTIQKPSEVKPETKPQEQPTPKTNEEKKEQPTPKTNEEKKEQPTPKTNEEKNNQPTAEIKKTHKQIIEHLKDAHQEETKPQEQPTPKTNEEKKEQPTPKKKEEKKDEPKPEFKK